MGDQLNFVISDVFILFLISEVSISKFKLTLFLKTNFHYGKLDLFFKNFSKNNMLSQPKNHYKNILNIIKSYSVINDNSNTIIKKASLGHLMNLQK
jgi:hypothetical protein